MFRQQFLALGGGGLNLTAGDAMLVYLSVYRYADACESTPSQMKQNLEKLWDEVKVLTEPQAVALSLEPKQGPGEPLLAKLNIFTKPSELKVVFLHEHNAEKQRMGARPRQGHRSAAAGVPGSGIHHPQREHRA